MEDVFSGTFGLIIGLFFIVWCVMMFFAPFYWFGTNSRTKEISEKMDKLIDIVEKNATAPLSRTPTEDTGDVSQDL